MFTTQLFLLVLFLLCESLFMDVGNDKIDGGGRNDILIGGMKMTFSQEKMEMTFSQEKMEMTYYME
jgi:hypothetical protein